MTDADPTSFHHSNQFNIFQPTPSDLTVILWTNKIGTSRTEKSITSKSLDENITQPHISAQMFWVHSTERQLQWEPYCKTQILRTQTVRRTMADCPLTCPWIPERESKLEAKGKSEFWPWTKVYKLFSPTENSNGSDDRTRTPTQNPNAHFMRYPVYRIQYTCNTKSGLNPGKLISGRQWLTS